MAANNPQIIISAEDKTDRAFRSIQGNLTKLDTEVGNVTDRFSALGGVIAGIASAGAVGSLVSSYRDFASELAKSSTQLGLSTEKLQILQGAAVNAGGSADDLTDALLTLDESIAEAGVEGGEKAAIFEALGVSLKNAKGEALSTEEVFLSLSGKIGGLEDAALQTKIANDLMGGSVNEIIDVIRGGESGFAQYEQKLRDVGGITSDVAIQDVAQLNENLGLLGKAFNSIGAEIISRVLNPALETVVTNFDAFKKVVPIVATALVTAAIPSLLTGITTALTALKLAIATNPIGALAVGVTTAGVAAYQYKDEIGEFFGLVDKDAAKETEKTADAIYEVSKQSKKAGQTTEDYAKAFEKAEENQKELKKTEEARTKTAKDFAKIINVVQPDVGEVNAAIKNLMGIEGFGGLQKALIEFLGGAHQNFQYYLGLTQSVVVDKLSGIQDEFTSVLSTIENIVVYRRDQVSTAFSDLMDTIKKEVEDLEIQVANMVIDVPADSFSFDKTIIPVDGDAFAFKAGSITVPASVFNTTNIESYNTKMKSSLQRTLDDINSIGVTGNRTAGRAYNIDYYDADGNLVRDNSVPYLTSGKITADPEATVYEKAINLPTYGFGANSLSSGRMATRGSSSTSSASSAMSSTPTIEVNIFDGTGQRISQYDSALRVEITERASRAGQFSAVAA